MSDFSRKLRPTDREVVELALRETDPREAPRFEPICRGPLFALLAIPALLLLSLPACLLRLLHGAWAGRSRNAE
jgi:hypothetical protein